MILSLAAGLLPLAAAAERFDLSVPMQQHASGNYYVHGVVGDGVETELLVDTGSGYVSLSKRTFARVRSEAVRVRDVFGTLANGNVVKVPIYRVSKLVVGTCRLEEVEVAVFPGAARDILGLSALREMEPFAMQLNPPELILSNCGETPALARAAAPTVPEGDSP